MTKIEEINGMKANKIEVLVELLLNDSTPSSYNLAKASVLLLELASMMKEGLYVNA